MDNDNVSGPAIKPPCSETTETQIDRAYNLGAANAGTPWLPQDVRESGGDKAAEAARGATRLEALKQEGG